MRYLIVAALASLAIISGFFATGYWAEKEELAPYSELSEFLQNSDWLVLNLHGQRIGIYARRGTIISPAPTSLGDAAILQEGITSQYWPTIAKQAEHLLSLWDGQSFTYTEEFPELGKAFQDYLKGRKAILAEYAEQRQFTPTDNAEKTLFITTFISEIRALQARVINSIPIQNEKIENALVARKSFKTALRFFADEFTVIGAHFGKEELTPFAQKEHIEGAYGDLVEAWNSMKLQVGFDQTKVNTRVLHSGRLNMKTVILNFDTAIGQFDNTVIEKHLQNTQMQFYKLYEIDTSISRDEIEMLALIEGDQKLLEQTTDPEERKDLLYSIGVYREVFEAAQSRRIEMQNQRDKKLARMEEERRMALAEITSQAPTLPGFKKGFKSRGYFKENYGNPVMIGFRGINLHLQEGITDVASVVGLKLIGALAGLLVFAALAVWQVALFLKTRHKEGVPE